MFWKFQQIIIIFFKFYAWGDPENLRKSETRTREKRRITLIVDVVSGYVSNLHMQKNWHFLYIPSTMEGLHQFSFFFA